METRKHTLIITALVMGAFISIYQTVSLNVALPGFMKIFDADLITVQWLMTGFTLATGIIAPLCGYLGNRFGTRELFLFSIAGLIIVSFFCAIAWNITSLIIFRILQGVFCGIIQPVTLTIIYQMLPASKQTFALGLWSSSSVLGPAFAPTISGWLQAWNWPLLFLIMLPFGAAAWILGWLSLDKIPAKSQKPAFNGIGMIGIVFGSLSLLMVFSHFQQWGILSIRSIVFLLLGIGLLVHFCWRELRLQEPLLDLRLFKIKDFSLSIAASAILTSSLYTGIYFIPLFLMEIQQMKAMEVGLLLCLPALSMTAATAISTKYYDRVGAKPFIVVGIFLIIFATLAFSKLKVDSSKEFVMFWMMIRYIGIGLSTTPAINSGMSSVPSRLSGDASALINWLKQAAGALSVGLFTSFFYTRISFHSLTNSHPQEVYIKGLEDVFLLVVLMTSLSLPLTLMLGKKETKQKKSKMGKEVTKGI